jgi:hypothetical protein
MPETEAKSKALLVELPPDIREQLEWLAKRDAEGALLPRPNLSWTIRKLIDAEWRARQKNPKKS